MVDMQRERGQTWHTHPKKLCLQIWNESFISGPKFADSMRSHYADYFTKIPKALYDDEPLVPAPPQRSQPPEPNAQALPSLPLPSPLAQWRSFYINVETQTVRRAQVEAALAAGGLTPQRVSALTPEDDEVKAAALACPGKPIGYHANAASHALVWRRIVDLDEQDEASELNGPISAKRPNMLLPPGPPCSQIRSGASFFGKYQKNM